MLHGRCLTTIQPFKLPWEAKTHLVEHWLSGLLGIVARQDWCTPVSWLWPPQPAALSWCIVALPKVSSTGDRQLSSNALSLSMASSLGRQHAKIEVASLGSIEQLT